MAVVRFTNHLRRYFADLREVEVSGDTVAQVVQELDQRFPGIKGYLCDDQGRLRRHVNIFIGEDRVDDRDHLSDPLQPASQIYILQALSGGCGSAGSVLGRQVVQPVVDPLPQPQR